RHTRFSRDWSSDVCSSDLMSPVLVVAPQASPLGRISVQHEKAQVRKPSRRLLLVAQNSLDSRHRRHMVQTRRRTTMTTTIDLQTWRMRWDCLLVERTTRTTKRQTGYTPA